MCIGAAIGEGDELCECVGAFGTAEEGRVAALGLGNRRRGEGCSAEGTR